MKLSEFGQRKGPLPLLPLYRLSLRLLSKFPVCGGVNYWDFKSLARVMQYVAIRTMFSFPPQGLLLQSVCCANPGRNFLKLCPGKKSLTTGLKPDLSAPPIRGGFELPRGRAAPETCPVCGAGVEGALEKQLKRSLQTPRGLRTTGSKSLLRAWEREIKQVPVGGAGGG